MDLPSPCTDHWFMADHHPIRTIHCAPRSPCSATGTFPLKATSKPQPAAPDLQFQAQSTLRARQESGRREEDGEKELGRAHIQQVGSRAGAGGSCSQTLSSWGKSEVSIGQMPSWPEHDSEAPPEIMRRGRQQSVYSMPKMQ